MDLILWRHADAEDGNPDSSRKLTAKGEKQAKDMAEWLRKRLPSEARVISSPAMRATQTVSALSDQFEILDALDTDASALSILTAAGWPDAKGAVVIVGHQPTLGQVAALLISGAEDGWSIKKGSIWWITNRVRGEASQNLLRAVMTPDLIRS